MTKRLVTPPRGFDPDSVSDLLVVLMANVEDALLASGAEKGTGYTRLDLLQAATPFVVGMFTAPGEAMTFTPEWPPEVFGHE